MWSGLGYYSRGQRLWEGAKKVCRLLQKNLMGTVSSIAPPNFAITIPPFEF